MTMIRSVCTAVAVFMLALAPAAVLADGSLSYDDPAIHYSAPDGWTRVDVEPGDDAPAAVFRKTFERYDTRAIMLKLQPYDGSLDGLETTHESEVRQQQDDVFIDKKMKITLSNGMPAWQLRLSMGQMSGNAIRSIEYLATDGRRSIVLSYSGRSGTFDDSVAIAALSTLTVVLYPAGR